MKHTLIELALPEQVQLFSCMYRDGLEVTSCLPVIVRCSLPQQPLAIKTITPGCLPCLLAVCAGIPSYSDSTFTWKDCDSQINVGGSCNASCADGYQEGPQGAATVPCTTTGWGEVSGGCGE